MKTARGVRGAFADAQGSSLSGLGVSEGQQASQNVSLPTPDIIEQPDVLEIPTILNVKQKNWPGPKFQR